MGEAQGVGRGKSPYVGCRSEDVVAQRMAVEYHVLKLVKYEFGRTIVVTFNLITDNFHLLIYLVLRINRVKDDVGQHVDGPGSVFFQDGSVVNGVFFGGEDRKSTRLNSSHANI